LGIGNWELGIIWDLGFGTWDFPLGIFLRFGTLWLKYLLQLTQDAKKGKRMRLFLVHSKYVIAYSMLIALLIGCERNSETVKSGKGIQWVEPKKWQSMGPISFKLQAFPDQEFMLVFPEWFTSDELNMVTRFNWDLKPYVAIGSWESESYASTLTIRFKQSEQKVELEWDYEFKNGSDKDVTNLAAFNCLNLNWAPLFKDLAMERTWIGDEKGKDVLLKQIVKTQGEGKRTMQFYPAIGGIELDQYRLIARWQVTSPTHLSGNRVRVESKDGRWQLETIVDGPVAYFFNNWEEDHGCIHTAPLFPSITPGESAMVKGWIIFTKRSAISG
jgi:hypothetical protein